MESEILQGMGFTSAEAKVYMTILQLGPAKVGQVIEKSGLQSSTVHNTVHSLLDKGHVSYILRGKIRIYQATSPKFILDAHKKKEKQFEMILPKLTLMQSLADQHLKAEIYEGSQGIMSLLNELIEDTKPDDTYYFFAVDVSGLNEEIQEFFERYDAKREAKGLHVKGLAMKQLRKLFEKRKSLKVKYTDFPIPSNISLCKDKMALITWGDRPHGVLMQSDQLVKSQITFFEELWSWAKP